MILPASDARRRWCPFSRVVVSERNGVDAAPVTFNRIAIRRTEEVTFPTSTGCIGPGCMMWEWDDRESQTGYCGLTQGRSQL